MEFYRETRFKDSEIGRVTEDWGVVRLGEFLTFKNGQRPELSENGSFFVYGANGIMGRTPKYLVDKDFTIIIGRVGASGEVHLGTGKIWISDNAIYSEKYDENKINMVFLYYTLKYKQLSRFATKTTHPIITQSFLNSYQIPLPPLSEQKAIAEILSTVDKAIEKTDEIIAKTERLKKGLMQELLTGRVRVRVENGKFSFYKETRFKDSEIGRVPEDWEVVRLKEVAKINVESINPPKEAPDEEFYYIEIDSIQNGRIKSVKKIIGKNAPSRARRIVRENDVIMSTVRPYLKTFAIVPREYDGQICSTGFAVLRCKKDLIIPEYLLYNLFMERTIEQCNRLMVGGQYPALNQSHVEKLKIPLPPLQEQKAIAEILSTVDKKLEIEKKEKERLERIKKGLMDVLLTGKVRLKVK